VRGANCAYSEGAIQKDGRLVVTTEQETTSIEIRDNSYWPDETLSIDFVEKDDRVEQADRRLEDSSEYATLYFVS
jgi:hypothetical protein